MTSPTSEPMAGHPLTRGDLVERLAAVINSLLAALEIARDQARAVVELAEMLDPPTAEPERRERIQALVDRARLLLADQLTQHH